MFEYCDIQIWLFIPCEKEMNVKCCLLKLKYPALRSDLHNTMLKKLTSNSGLVKGHTWLMILPLNMKAIGLDVNLSLCTLPGML